MPLSKSNVADSIIDLSSQSPSENDQPTRTITGYKWALTYLTLMWSVLLYALDTTIMADLQPAIINAFKTQRNLAWVGVGYALGNICILTIGKLYAALDKKPLYLACLLLFELGSLLCGLAPSMPLLITGRVIAGIGGCGLYSGAIRYVSLLTTHPERPAYIAGLYAVWGIGCVLGPLVGGGLAESSAGWRWGFLINLPIAAVFLPGFLFCLPSAPPAQPAAAAAPCAARLRAVDWLASAVFAAGAACFTCAVNFGGSTFAWASAAELALLCATAALLAAFIAVTVWHPGVAPAQRLLPVGIMRTRQVALVVLQAPVASSAIFVTLYYTPLVSQFTRGDGPLDGGLRILPLIAAIVVASFAQGYFMPRWGYCKPWFVVGNALIVTGSALMYTISIHTPDAIIYLYTVLIGAGIGCFESAIVSVVGLLVSASLVDDAVTMVVIAQVMGNVGALSATGSLFQNLVARNVARLVPTWSAADVAALTTGTSSAVYARLDAPLREEVVVQVLAAIRAVFLVPTAACAAGLILAVFMSNKKLYV